MTNNKQALIIGISLVVAAFVFGLFFYKANQKRSWISVIGSATKPIDSDSAKLIISLSKYTDLASYNKSSQKLRSEIQNLSKIFQQNGFAESDINIYHQDSQKDYNDKNFYTLTQKIDVSSSELAKIEILSQKLNNGLESPVNHEIQYYIKKNLPVIKRELIAEATKDAKKRAESIAKTSGLSVGKIASVSSGIFQITEPLSTEVSDSGIYSTATKKKEVAITVNVSFELK